MQLAPPVVIEGLVGGTGSLIVSHAQLGVAASELALAPGAADVVELQWQDLEHSPAVRQRYLDWLGERERVRRASRARAVTGGAVGVAGVIVSVVGWAVAAEAGLDLRNARDAAVGGAVHPSGPDGWFLAHEAALERERGGVALGLMGAGFGAAGLALAGVFAADGTVRIERVGAWTPP